MIDSRNPARVRLTHKSGVSASCDCERSQHRNREKAYALLKARLFAAPFLTGPQPVVRDYLLEGEQ